MNKPPLIKDDRVLEINVNDRTVWIVRFTNSLFLKKAFDSLAELHEALGADQRHTETEKVLPDEDAPWAVAEFRLKNKPLYAVYNCTEGKLVDKGRLNRWDAEETADLLNQRPPHP